MKNLSMIQSDQVIGHLQSYKTHKKYYMITELCNGGDLQMLKAAKGKLTEEEARLIVRKVIKGLDDLFKYDLVHRDLKLSNILLHFHFEDTMRVGNKEYSELDLISLSTKEKIEFLA